MWEGVYLHVQEMILLQTHSESHLWLQSVKPGRCDSHIILSSLCATFREIKGLPTFEISYLQILYGERFWFWTVLGSTPCLLHQTFWG